MMPILGNEESIVYRKNAHTGRMYTCNAGGVTDTHHIARYHFLPEPPNLADLLSKGSKLLRLLAANITCLERDNRSGLILGGDDSMQEYREDSRTVFQELLRFFQRRRIDVSYFWGQDNINDSRGVEAYYTASDDTWRILKYKKGSKDTVQTVADLADSFAEVHLSPQDTLYLADRKHGISASEFEHEMRQISEQHVGKQAIAGS